MIMRRQFDLELENLQNKIVEMAQGAKSQLERAVQSIYEKDLELAADIIEADAKIDQLDLDINDAAILLIAKQQPVASDLRRLIVALRVSTDLERMADNARNIARSTIALGADHELEIDSALKDMCEVAYEMLDLAIKSFKDEDYKLAKQLSEMDDSIDRMFDQVLERMLGLSANNPQKIQHVMHIAYTARYIERFGDHLTNIAESILYLVKGETLDLNE